MKKKLKKLIPVLRQAAWIAGAFVLFILTGAAISHQNNMLVKGFKISINHDTGLYFVNEEDVMQLIQDNNFATMVHKPMQNLDYRRLEKILENNPHISRAEIFVNNLGEVRVNVTQRIPILRVINNTGVSFYIDQNGNKMPISNKFTARVPVATGNIFDSGLNEDVSDTLTTKKLYRLASYISTDSILNALVEQVYVTQGHEFTVVPKVGNHIVELGDANELNDKFTRLLAFYRDGLNKVGWQQYSVVNLRYRNQVLATRRNAVKFVPAAPVTTQLNPTNQPLNLQPNEQQQ